MWQRRLRVSLVLAAAVTLVSAPGHAGQTCSDRKQVCLAYCEKQYANAPRCLDACSGLLNQCFSTGCWDSKVTGKRCGFARQ